MDAIAAIKRANQTKRPEGSVVLRVATLGAVMLRGRRHLGQRGGRRR